MAHSESNNLKEVAVLQNFGIPFSCLYADMKNRVLYILVRSDRRSRQVEKYTAATVTANEVEEYMNEEKSLNDIFRNNSLYSVLISEKDIRMEKLPSLDEDFDNSINYFDPEFFDDDDIWVETFLNRMKKGKPLEIV